MRRWALVVAVAGVLALAAGSAGAGPPHCLGAAARDPLHPCANRALRHRVIPSPADALILPNSPCQPSPDPAPYYCTFGSPQADARATVALIGDSHATHWRAALQTVAARHHWHGISMTRSGCPLTMATQVLPEPGRSGCLTWNAQVQQFLADHPEISTVVVSEHRGRVITAPGQTVREGQVQGYLAAWRALPDTVTHIIVIRDTPYDRTHTGDCVEQAERRKEEPGLVCAIPRSDALKPDPGAIAAQRLAGTRVSLVDLTHYMCSPALCFPVVGGVLVHKDVNHIGVTFGTTLGPYLLRAIDRVLGAAAPAR